MLRPVSLCLRALCTTTLLLLACAVLAPSSARAASAEAAILHEKISGLRSLQPESFEWQLLALDIARTLKAMPASSERSSVLRVFKPQVESFVRKDAHAAADQRIRATTEAWVQRMGKLLAAQGLEMRTRARQDKGARIASVDYAQMRQTLAKKLATETELSNSARLAGFDALEFVNSATRQTWRFQLAGGEHVHAQVLREAASEWGLDEL